MHFVDLFKLRSKYLLYVIIQSIFNIYLHNHDILNGIYHKYVGLIGCCSVFKWRDAQKKKERHS